ncbi:MAG TPA: ATP-binding protein [Acidimicrobiia bacterium]|nr:ATP-binding protein [Acidimicrobiia bacterium]
MAESERLAADASRAADRFRMQRDRLAAALADSVEGVVIVDRDGVEVFRNVVAERFRNARHADAVAERTIGALIERSVAGETVEEDLQLFGPPRALLRLRALPLVDGGVRLGAAVFVHDVSETHRVDNVRRDFVANVSHELKTPIGALELLAETLAAEPDPEVARPLVERLAKEAERLGRIVDDLLDLSLIETQEAVSAEVLEVDALVDEAADRIRPSAMVGGIGLQVHHGSDGAHVECDHRQVVSAVVNLLDNAVKYSESGKVVSVETERDGDDVVIAVSDDGIGVPSRDLERIFERFYRVDQARSRDTGGTGLGLAIVRHVAQVHGGDVTVESLEGQGSTFRLRLPIAIERAVSAETQEVN